MRNLNEVEIDFIEFISKKTAINSKEIEIKYLKIIEEFSCHSSGFKDFMDKVYRLNKLLYDYEVTEQQIESYKQHELMQLIRYLSYSYIKSVTKTSSGPKTLSFYGKLRHYFVSSFIRDKRKTDLSFLQNSQLTDNDFNIKNWHSGLAYQHKKLADYLCSLIREIPVVVDYGSGLGYISFEIGKKIPGAKIYLVDIDSLVQEFARYRFTKHNIDVELITIRSSSDLYPLLPPHNICIATEVMEHVNDPVKVLKNMRDSLRTGGIIFGNFQDHSAEEQHISCDLSDVRKSLENDFTMINEMTWLKKN